MIIDIYGKNYHVEENEFSKKIIEKYCNIDIIDGLNVLERIVAFIDDVIEQLQLNKVLHVNPTHGGFVALNVKNGDNLTFCSNNHNVSINDKNILNLKSLDELSPTIQTVANLVTKSNDSTIIFKDNDYVVITKQKIGNNFYTLSNTEYIVYVSHNISNQFEKCYNYCIKDKVLSWDNLINLCIMVKNAGDTWKYVLEQNKDMFDRYTILDTGSTDDTVNTVKTVYADKRGEIYEEPFINFKDSRNRLLDLAGTKCKFTIMLDDTYIVRGNIRQFLTTVRANRNATSFSFFVKSHDVEYMSNRVLDTKYGLRYIYKIHEVIQMKNNKNFVIPIDDAHIEDINSDYMQTRTKERKLLDLKLLFEELEENPDDPRTYYYIAQTYHCLGDMQQCYEWHMKRANHKNDGFLQEKIDSIFEAGRLANFQLNKPWDLCMQLYLRAFNLDQTRPEGMYFIGIHYYLQNDYKTAYKYFKTAFEIGFPRNSQFNLRPTLTYHYNPKFLSKICYLLNDFILGKKASTLFLQNNDNTVESYSEMVSWYNIYDKLTRFPVMTTAIVPTKKILCFVADGGFNKWDGQNIYTTGVGGSETYIIEMARNIALSNKYDVYVFCNCESPCVIDNVTYLHLDHYYQFINTTQVEHVIVSRFTEYVPLSLKGHSSNVHIVLHDLGPSGCVIPIDNKLKNIFCLTKWHVNYFLQSFPQFDKITKHLYYGVDTQRFKPKEKTKLKFIYSSFANRGLLILLKMWPQIYARNNDATLHIYCDVNNEWVNNNYKDMMIEIRKLLDEYKTKPNNFNIYYHGWVTKKELSEGWETADIWFYPCIFAETFCLTALESSITKTLIVCNDLAALQNTVSDRGIVIPGDPTTETWQNNALEKLFSILDGHTDALNLKNQLVEKAYSWASALTWNAQSLKLLNEIENC